MKNLRIILSTLTLALGMTVSSFAEHNTSSSVEPRAKKALKNEMSQILAGHFLVDVYLIPSDGAKTKVKLEGQVASIHEREMLVAKLEALPSVAHVIEQLDIVENKLLDEELSLQLAEQLNNDPSLDLTEITYEVEDKIAFLYGMTDSPDNRTKIENATKKIKGIQNISNNIVLFTEIKKSRSDKEILHHILDELKKDTLIDESYLQVQVQDRKVRLKGIVTSYILKDLVVARASVEEVEDIMASEVIIFANSPKEDLEYIKRRSTPYDVKQIIRKIIDQYPSEYLSKTNIAFDDSNVLLQGFVSESFIKEDIHDQVLNIIGVDNVQNDLVVMNDLYQYPTIGQETNQTATVSNQRTAIQDYELKRAIQSHVENLQSEITISVQVKDGIVFLEGIIESKNKLQSIEQAAYRNGAISIENNVLTF